MKGNTSIRSVLENKNPIILKCALTVTFVMIDALQNLTLFFSQILSQTNACAHTAVSAHPAYPPLYINSIWPIGIILPCLYRPDK